MLKDCSATRSLVSRLPLALALFLGVVGFGLRPHPLFAKPASAEDASVVRNRYLSYLKADRGEVKDPRYQKGMAAFDEEVSRELAGQILDPSHEHFGTWGDATDAKDRVIGYNGGWVRHIGPIALAYARPASRYYQDPELLKRVGLALKGYG